MRRFISVLLAPALLAVSSALLLIPGTAVAAPAELNYVALGDSYASGPLIPSQTGSPFGCLRSNHNYPSLLAQKLAVSSFTDVSCGGAATKDMAGPQTVLLGKNAAQFSALRADTNLVTLTIGGNDIGFTDIAVTCATVGLLNPAGAPCQQHYATAQGDQLAINIQALAPKVAAVLQGIHQRSPQAKVVMVGYLRILPPSGGCWPIVPFATGDVPYLDGVEQHLNTMLAQQAAANKATFVDPYSISLGHDVCQLPGTKWVEGIVPTSLAAPIHPNALGMAAVADLVRSKISTH